MIEVTMELEPHLPKEERRFMAKYDRYEPKIRDSTSIQTLKVCPRKYFYQIVLGRNARDDAPYFAWGSAYHKFREVLERSYGFGHNLPKPFDQDKANEAFTLATNAGLKYWDNHGSEQPVGSKWAFMTKARLLKSFIVAYTHWTKEKKQGRIEVIAVEQAFNVMLEDGSFTSGRADQIIRWNGKPWGRDFKTTSKDTKFYSRGLEPNDQFTRYTLAEGKMTGEMIQGQFVEVLYNANGTQKDPDKNGPAIVEFTTSRTPYQLKTFEQEQRIINRTLEIYRAEDSWPMHEPACPFCPFHSVCVKPTEGAMMAQLEQHFVVRPWDNTKVGVLD